MLIWNEDSSRSVCATTASCPSGSRVLGSGVDGSSCLGGYFFPPGQLREPKYHS